jgi:hypothetical protein
MESGPLVSRSGRLNGSHRSPALARDTTHGDVMVIVHHRWPPSNVGTALSHRVWLQWRSPLPLSPPHARYRLCSCSATRRSTHRGQPPPSRLCAIQPGQREWHDTVHLKHRVLAGSQPTEAEQPRF